MNTNIFRFYPLSGRLDGAALEVYLFFTGFADMFFIEFVGEDFPLRAAFRALYGESLQVLKLLESRAVLRCTHNRPPYAG